jgi:pyruvate/2-oxoglutarate dehydrogenase complex dihydrolipoamide acyltransferase (E2) component
VTKAAAAAGSTTPPGLGGGKGTIRVLELTATQSTIARRMVESATTIPFFTVTADIDMSQIAESRRGHRTRATTFRRSTTSS